MESKSIIELNKEVQKSLQVIRIRPEPITEQQKFNAFMLNKLNELCLQFSKGRRSFEVTEENQELLSAVFAYLNRSNNDSELSYKGNVLDLDKGLLFLGPFGVGKSLLMRVIFENRNLLKLTGRFVTSQQVFDYPKKELETIVGKDKYGLFIDDIGEEPNVLNDFGTQDTPVGNLLKARMDAWERYPEAPKLFISTNCKETILNQVYGGRVVSRLYDACNVLVSSQKTDYRKL